MKKSLVQVFIIRGKFYLSESDKHLRLVEFDGIHTALSPEPHIIINESANTDLTAFLANSIEVGRSFVTMYFTETTGIEGLFDDAALCAVPAPRQFSGEITLTSDGLISIGGEDLYQTFWDNYKGDTEKYVYMEVNVHG